MNPVSEGEYTIHPLSLQLGSGKWQAVVVVSRFVKTANENTKTHSRSFPISPMIFESQHEAEEYALSYGRKLLANNDQDLPPAPHSPRG